MSVKIMAIINTSPDSFNGDGVDVADETLLRQRIQTAVDEGADILDIGGQSTRPGAEIVSIEEELHRVLPTIDLAKEICNLPLSVDTFKPEVASVALQAGVSIVNDIHGCEDPDMRDVVANSSAEVVIMHSRGTPKTMSSLTDYHDVTQEVISFLKGRAEQLQQMGVDARRIIIDPGIGFAKTAPQSFELTKHIEEFTNLGYRVLYGASQKSFLGKALAKNGEMAPPHERAVATAVVQAYAMQHGISIVRVHDVKAAVQTRTILETLEAKQEIMP